MMEDDFGFEFGGERLNKEEVIEKTREALEKGGEWLQKIALEWQEDGPTGDVARGMVAAGTLQLDILTTAVEEAVEDPTSINPLVLALAISSFEAHMKMLAMLNALADLSKRSE